MKKVSGWWVVALFFVFGAGGASAVTLNVVSGQLVGASGVIVAGNSYNVEFLDGTCIALFSGCDSSADFTFTTQSAAASASQALLDQVFLDVGPAFDSNPELTAGCTNSSECQAVTPYAVTPFVTAFYASAINFDPTTATDFVATGGTSPGTDVVGASTVVFAVWSPVPEPGTAILMGLGLIGLGARRRTT